MIFLILILATQEYKKINDLNNIAMNKINKIFTNGSYKLIRQIIISKEEEHEIIKSSILNEEMKYFNEIIQEKVDGMICTIKIIINELINKLYIINTEFLNRTAKLIIMDITKKKNIEKILLENFNMLILEIREAVFNLTN